MTPNAMLRVDVKIAGVSKRTGLVFATAFASVLVLWPAPAGAFRAKSSPCDLIRSNLEKVLGLPQVWERPVIGAHGKSAPDVASTCKIEAWDASKPASKKELDERIVRGSAAVGYVRTWVANPRSPDVAKWRDTLFRRTLDHAMAGCASLGKDPDGAKLRLPLDGAQSAVGYQGVKVGLDACGVWDRGSPHPSSGTSTGQSSSGRTDLGDYRIITIQLQQSPQKPVATDLTGIAKYLVGGYWHTNALLLLHLYWNDFYDGTLSEAGVDGANPHVIVTGQTGPSGIAIGSSDIYWANTNASTVNEANLDGSNPHTIVADQYVPGNVAVDGSHIYWTTDGAMWEANLDGSSAHTVIAGGISFLTALAVDSSHIYWTAGGQANPTAGTINEANLDGSNPQTIVDSLHDPAGIAVGNDHIYWTDFSADTLSVANSDGSDPQTIATGQIDPVGVAVDSSQVYWVNTFPGTPCSPNSCTIKAARLDGSNRHTLVTVNPGANSVAVGW